MNYEPFISRVEITRKIPKDEYISELPVVKNLINQKMLIFDTPVTFFVGENGIGKSTLIEAMAISLGFNPEGGTKNFVFSSKDTHSSLCDYITVSKTANRIKNGFFYRAESFYNVATYIDTFDNDLVKLSLYYGGESLHEQSHGESFLSLLFSRPFKNGLYIFDEPEASLSPMNILKMISIMHEMIKNGCQFIISTHSPILMMFPEAKIYQFTENSIEAVSYRETEHYILTKRFMDDPEWFCKYLD